MPRRAAADGTVLPFSMSSRESDCVNQEHETPVVQPEEAVATVADEAGEEGAARPEELAPEQAEIARLNIQLTELKDEILRARAELDNARKRAERDVEAAHKYGQERLIQEILPVKDSLDLGLAAAHTATDIEGLRQGMSLTAKMFADFLEKLGIQAVDPVGERFDPERHQAMTTEESAETPPGTVVRVMQKGYLLNERLLRPALVVVARAPTTGEGA